jgi:hypothetical protein
VLERRPNFIVDLVNFIPALRDDYAGLILTRQLQVADGVSLVLVRHRALLDGVQLVHSQTDARECGRMPPVSSFLRAPCLERRFGLRKQA